MTKLDAATEDSVDGRIDPLLALWDLPGQATSRLLNLSENRTYLCQAGDFRSVLRVHRLGNHSLPEIESEIAWTDALREDGALLTPRVLPARAGQKVLEVDLGAAGRRFMVMFEFVPGRSPDPDGDLATAFENLGGIAARAHLHAIGWPRPAGFVRMKWNVETILDKGAAWGDWRDAPHVNAPERAILEPVEARVRATLAALGRGPGDYGLIHADMRLANLLVDGDAARVIDFDDCGFGWFLYDFAAAVSFLEDDARLPGWKAAWLRGYQRVRPLPESAPDLIDTFIMLRRLALLAWIGSRIESPEPQALAVDFARVSAKIGARYLGRG